MGQGLMQPGEGHGKPHAYVVGSPRHSEGHGGTHLYVTAGARKDHRYWHEVLSGEMSAPGMHHLPNNPSAAKALSSHLDAQGEPEDSPLRAVLGNGKTSHQLVHRSEDGRITGAVAYTHYPRDKEVSVHDVRAMRKGEGVGTAMITELARRHPGHTMAVYNVVDNARDFYARTGADFKSHSSVGSWDHEAMQALRDGSPLRKQAPPKDRPSRIVEAVSVSWDHQDENQDTWTDDYRKWAQERPHGVAVNRAQEHVRRHVPTMEMELGSTEDATSSMQHMLRKGGHPDADDGFVMKHHDPRRGVSQAYFSDGEPGVALHEDRWDYGTLAHEVAHHLHMHEMGRKPHDDAEAHGPDFIRHYQSVLKDFGHGAAEKLGEHYHKTLGRIRGEASRKSLFCLASGADRGPHTDAVYRVHHAQGISSMHPALAQSPGEGAAEASETLQGMLRHLGHPDADYAFVIRHPHPERGISTPVHSDGDPGVALHPAHWTNEYLAHEAAHLMHSHATGREPNTPLSDEDNHGSGFRSHLSRLYDYLSPPTKDFPGAGEEFEEHVRHHLGGRTAAQEPSARLFGPTHGLDKRLFEGEHLKPDVRRYILETLGQFWKGKHGVDWDEWARVYFAGSEASTWTSETLVGNGDFDVLIGVDYDAYRSHQESSERSLTDEEITDELNMDLRRLVEKTTSVMIPVEGRPEGPFAVTFYVNHDSWDIRKIKPYAAYDVTNDRWAVKPPDLPDWDITKFPEGKAFLDEAHAVAAYVRAILEMPEPYRSQQGNALWEHLHSDRSRAFGPQGEGWYDPGNTLEKYLDQLGLWEQLAVIHFAARDHPEKLDAPADWSNDPRSASV